MLTNFSLKKQAMRLAFTARTGNTLSVFTF